MTAVHDTLRQAIAGEIGAWGTRGNEYRPLADAILTVVMAVPSVARRFAIADAVDNWDGTLEWTGGKPPDTYAEGFTNGFTAAQSYFRAAGETT